MGGHHAKIPPKELCDLCSRTCFDEKELKMWHDKFKKEYPSGSITKQDFIKLYRDYYKSGDAKRFSEHVFRVFDANNDGRIGMNINFFINDRFKIYDFNEKLTNKEKILKLVKYTVKKGIRPQSYEVILSVAEKHSHDKI